MTEDFERRLIKPIVNASYPATLAGLALFGLQVTYLGSPPVLTRLALSLGGIMFLIAATCIFFYTLYPTRRRLWSVSAITFLVGLLWLFVATAVTISIA